MRPLGREGFLRMFDQMSSRDRRAVFLGLAVLLPALVYALGVRPYLTALADVREQTFQAQGLLARELELLERAGELPEAARLAREVASGVQGRMLQARSLVLAEGELTDFLEAAAYRSRVLLEEIRGGELARGEEPPPGLSLVRMHLRGESDLEGVLTFLDQLEKSHLLLRIRGLALEPEVSRPDSEEEDQGSRDPVPTGVVEFQMIVDGFALGEGMLESQESSPSGRMD
jgi:hypothetical protein